MVSVINCSLINVFTLLPKTRLSFVFLFHVEIKQCQNPAALRNGKIVGLSETGKTDVGVVIDYSCNDDSSMLIGPRKRFCKMDGSWSGFQPECLNPKAGIVECPDQVVFFYRFLSLIRTLIIVFVPSFQVLFTIAHLIQKPSVVGLRLRRTRPSDNGS